LFLHRDHIRNLVIYKRARDHITFLLQGPKRDAENSPPIASPEPLTGMLIYRPNVYADAGAEAGNKTKLKIIYCANQIFVLKFTKGPLLMKQVHRADRNLFHFIMHFEAGTAHKRSHQAATWTHLQSNTDPETIGPNL
jgi:hypothetical protein